ncbi:MAG: hypothetical protein ABI855_07870 [Bacteroidota bacterium]
MMKKLVTNLLFVLISVFVTLCVGEFIYRKMIFSKSESFKKFRLPGDYADSEWDVNYWKLAQIWEITKPPKPNQVVGWGYEFWSNSFFHPDVEHLNGRRSVLIYGDSFANCIDSTQCFDEYLNNDSAFAKNNFIINYGTGGYGVDQIYTLMKNSHSHYKNPYVIFSFLTFDLDRSGLSFREGQKPFYTFDENGELTLNTSKFNPDEKKYLEENPPQIKSYLWKKFLYSKMNFLPESCTQSLKGEKKQIEFLKKVNTKLIQQAADELRKTNTDFVFLIFEGYNDFTISPENNWRVSLKKEILEKEKIPNIWARDLIKNDYKPENPKDIDRFLIPGDGHPTTYFNNIVSEEIKKMVFENELNTNFEKKEMEMQPHNFYYSEQIDSTVLKINSDITRLAEVKRLAKEKNISDSEMLVKHAIYILWDKYENKKGNQ